MGKKKLLSQCYYSKCGKDIYEGENAVRFSMEPDMPELWFCSKEHGDLWLFTELIPEIEKGSQAFVLKPPIRDVPEGKLQ